MKVGIISITSNGDTLIKQLLNQESRYLFDVYESKNSKEKKIRNIVEDIFDEVDGIIFITSLGICVRTIAPYIKSKESDPAVLCIPNDGSKVISVLSGHLGGANALAMSIGSMLNALPIITTATDIKGIMSPDMIAKEYDLYIDNMEYCKKIAAMLVDDRRVAIKDDSNDIQIDGYEKFEKSLTYDGIVHITNSINKDENITLKLIRKDIVIGIGCRKNYGSDLMRKKVLKVLKDNNIHDKSIAKLCTVEIKKDERAILELAKYFNVEMNVHSIQKIQEVEHFFKGSDFVKAAIDVSCVAEPSVHLSGGVIFIKKMKLDGMTISIGQIKENK